jgi:hypothetical protein
MHADANAAAVREGDNIGARKMLLLRRIQLWLNPKKEEHVGLFEKLRGFLGTSKSDSVEAAEERSFY